METRFKKPCFRGGSRGRDDLRFSNTTGILPKKTMLFIAVEVEQETSAPPPKKNPGSAPVFTAQIESFSGYKTTSTTSTRTAKKAIGLHL